MRILWLKRGVRRPLFWLVISYILVGLVYTLVTPESEKPDEHGHYGYILYLRERRTLPPLLSFEGRQLAEFKQADQISTRSKLASEFKQPPLYYVITAVLSSWLPDDPDPDQLLAPNPYVFFSVPGYRNDNRNRFLHPPDMSPLILTGRLVSLGFGLCNLLASYFFAEQLFPGKSIVPIATAAVVGFQPNLLYIATAVNNDMAVTCFGTLTLTLLMYRLKKGHVPHFAVLVGVMLGLASITKVSALVFFPLTGLALLLVHRNFRPALFRDGAIILVVAMLVGGWWYARNAILYNDPLTISTHASDIAQTKALGDRLKHDLSSIERTYWANLSHFDVSLIWLDSILIWWGRISLGLVVLSFWLKSQFVRANLPVIIVLLSWPATFLCLLIFYWTQRGPWAFGRLLFPTVAPTTLLFMWGWQTAFPLRWQRSGLALCMGLVMLLGILTPVVSLYPLFHPWREWQAQQVQHPVGTAYVEPGTGRRVARLIGYNPLEPYVLAGSYIPIELCWEPLGRTDVPYAVFVQFLDLSQLSVRDSPGTWGQRETFPGLGNRPTDRWPLHRAFCDTVLILASPGVPTPLDGALEVGFTDPEHTIRLQAVDSQGDPIDLAVIGHLPILSPQDLPTAKQPARYAMDNAIGLLHAQASEAVGSSITLTLTWQSLRTVPYNATMFAHVRAADGSMAAQLDRQPLEGRFPTSLWLPGQIITDVVRLPLGPGVSDGRLVLNVGMYLWPSLQRLPVTDATGIRQRDDAIVMDIPFSPDWMRAP